jgi:hypothetical protein
MHVRTILLQPQAPPKPTVSAACNGCGLCCAAEPCPLGMAVSRRRQGACAALLWRADEGRYACGVLDDPGRWLPGLPSVLARRLARRWIAAGRGCDCDLEPAPATAEPPR